MKLRRILMPDKATDTLAFSVGNLGPVLRMLTEKIAASTE